MREEHTTLDAPNPMLWVRLAPEVGPDPELRWLIAGSASTHRARFHLCSTAGDLHRSANVYEVVEASHEALWWLDGFLTGQQASLWEFLGSDDELFEASDADDVKCWEEWNRRLFEDGDGPSRLERLPARDGRLGDLGAPVPWCYVGSLYRVWLDNDWRVADPQPTQDLSGGFWPGSECDLVDAHDLEQVDENLTLCQRCHLITE